jgi:AraC-like DNA-binding protein
MLLGRMRDESKHRDPFAAHIQNGLLLQVVCAIARALPPEQLSPLFLQRPAVQGFSERIYRVFEQHLGENFSAATISHKMAVSVRTLTKRCQEVFGWPPARAFKQYKMEYAAKALRQSDLSIKEISHRLGFQNQYHFSRVFRQCVGVPPSHYRHSAEGTPLAT